MYQPLEGDIYIQETFINKAYVYLSKGKTWEFQSVLSKEEADKLITTMQLMHDTKVGRVYYRPILVEPKELFVCSGCKDGWCESETSVCVPDDLAVKDIADSMKTPELKKENSNG